eukprot:GHVU01109361.1.p1 GENE.GHVU01109361.1~~GHVU01109361.1.p1  ORF type:complete len:188 (+),score=29.07 GHVU01109361.1:715-1278(+)
MALFSVVKFETKYKGSKAVDWVMIAPVGEAFERTKTWHQVEKLRPPKSWDDDRKDSPTYRDMEAKWTIIGPAYDAWKDGLELPEDGTPLAAWSGITADQAEYFKRMGIKTVEAIRDMSESGYSKLPFPSANKLPKLAGDFLAGRDGADLAQKLADAEERMAAMEEMLKAQTRKPGRPRKEVSNEEAA